MRFMMLVKATADSEAGVMPSEEELAAMGEYNEALVNAGVMLEAEGLHASSKGARVTFEGGESTVTDGPFTETKELVAGYWIIQVESRSEAIEWARRVPFEKGQVEVRRVFEAEDFGDEFTPELREQEERNRAKAADNKS